MQNAECRMRRQKTSPLPPLILHSSFSSAPHPCPLPCVQGRGGEWRRPKSLKDPMRSTSTKPIASPADLAAAVEVFVRGYAFTRSFTYPYHPERVDGVWVVRDAPRKKAADYRR